MSLPKSGGIGIGFPTRVFTALVLLFVCLAPAAIASIVSCRKTPCKMQCSAKRSCCCRKKPVTGVQAAPRTCPAGCCSSAGLPSTIEPSSTASKRLAIVEPDAAAFQTPASQPDAIVATLGFALFGRPPPAAL